MSIGYYTWDEFVHLHGNRKWDFLHMSVNK